MMDIYLVGGAVRDSLLGLPVTERDYVVVGATEQEMLDAGYRTVGRDFPVFLHPKTQEEYALARTEKKVSAGHTGFICHASPDVTLEEDLQRRDLTINAIARTPSGEIIDPINGQVDLKAKSLKHVSDAFQEDPLRVLRLARFYARFYHLGFSVHPSTNSLVTRMVAEGQLSELSPERILGELDKALRTRSPAVFFDYLNAVGAGDILWPEISEPHIESLRRLSADNNEHDADTCFAALTRQMEEAELSNLCKRIKVSNNRAETSLLVMKLFTQWCRLEELESEQVMDLFQQSDAVRKQVRFGEFNDICASISHLPLAGKWADLLEIVAAVRATDIKTGETGPALGAAIAKAQTDRVRAALQDQNR